MFRIGLDLDNTIVCYDHTFYSVALSMGLIKPEISSSKESIKSHILNLPGGDFNWQRLQGQVYGKHMLSAEMFPGLMEFLILSKLRGHKIFIVSHKTEFGHFDENQIPLREQAMLWMKENHFFGKDGFGIDVDDVFFESSREEKVRRVGYLACTHFIDDLSEVFEEKYFPLETKKILFQPSQKLFSEFNGTVVTSWRNLTQILYCSWAEEEISRVAELKFPALGITNATLKKGRGNSKVYKLSDLNGNCYALKVYPDRQLDHRPRLETEFSVCEVLRANGYPVVEAIASNKGLGWGIYRWISEAPISAPDDEFMLDAIKFVRCLVRDSWSTKKFDALQLASESCLSGSEVERQIYRRLEKLRLVESKELSCFLIKEFIPCFELLTQVAKSECGFLFDEELPRSKQVLSPADFGSHNALRSNDCRTTFIDFEYCGWDDPVKLVSDFYWHPAMCLSHSQRKQWLKSCLEIFKQDSFFPGRLSAFLPLYGLRWCLIILNEFLRSVSQNRLHADPERHRDMAQIRFDQLKKAKMLLKEIRDISYT